MSENTCHFHPIGVIHSPHSEAKGTPIQPRYSEGFEGTVELLPEYGEALADLDGFERIWLIYAFDRSDGWKPKVTPFRDTVERGLFATRAPKRPNAIGMSCVRLIRIEGATLFVSDIDILDGTPLLDIKPYVPDYDAYPESQAGWLDCASRPGAKADQRFVDDK
jgi:tRNA-Thr(GGU) m(6)t(6)A37 methyltransferase TsaA